MHDLRQTPAKLGVDHRHLGDGGLVFRKDESIGELPEDAQWLAAMYVNIRAAKVAQRFPNPPGAGLKDAPSV